MVNHEILNKNKSNDPERGQRFSSQPSRRTSKWFVYIAESRVGRYYTGIARDPKKRIKLHNQGFGSKFARDQGPLILVYRSRPYETKSAARVREIQIKKWTRVKKIKLIRGIYY